MLEHPKAQDTSNVKILEDEAKAEMDNQQVTQAEFGWLAGIIDGEGYLGIQRYKTRNNHMSYTVELSICNTDEQIIIKVRDIIKKLEINPYINQSSFKMKHRPNHKMVWKIVIHRMSPVMKILQRIKPFLVGAKKERAELIIEYCTSRLNNFVQGSHYKNVITEREVQIVESCIAMQKRGTSETTRKAQLERSILGEEIRLRAIKRKVEYGKEWDKNNREKKNQYTKNWREKNSNHIKEYKKQYRANLKNQFRSVLTDDDIVRPYVKA